MPRARAGDLRMLNPKGPLNPATAELRGPRIEKTTNLEIYDFRELRA